MKFASRTFGCKVNQYETQMMRELLGVFYEEAGQGEAPDLVLVNTCSVTARADREARQALRRYRRKHPGAVILAAGCLARRPGVDLVAEGLADRTVAAPTAGALLEAIGRPVPERGAGITRFDGRTRAFLKVQDGCDRRCTFCVIPSIRGGSVSRSAAELSREAARLASGGVPEIVLCGVRLNAYRDPETGAGLGGLLDALLNRVPGPRFRLSSLYPGRLDPQTLALLAGESRIVPHLHLPIQSGSDRVLKAMGRGYGSADIVGLAGEIRRRRPEFGLTADVLVGYPTEREEDVAATARLVHDCGFHRLHVFPFSPRPGTPAALLPPLAAGVVASRRERMTALGAELGRTALARQVGSVAEVVVERETSPGWSRGFSGAYHPVAFPTGPHRAGETVRVRVTGVSGEALTGRVEAAAGG